MPSRLALLCFCISLTVAEETTWEKDMQAGKLPEMTLNQQMQLFGAKIAVTAPPPTPTEPPEPTSPKPWWMIVDNGSLPPMTADQKMTLFGSTVVEEETPKTNYQESTADNSYYYGAHRSQRSLDTPVNTDDIGVKLLLTSDDFMQGRGRMKKILIPVLLAMTVIAAIVLPALMTVIKLIAVKGLWSGIVSLIISKMLGLKALLSHHHHHNDQNSRPYFVYLNHGKHRREEGENVPDYQIPNGVYDQHGNYGQGEWGQWKRGAIDKV